MRIYFFWHFQSQFFFSEMERHPITIVHVQYCPVICCESLWKWIRGEEKPYDDVYWFYCVGADGRFWFEKFPNWDLFPLLRSEQKLGEVFSWPISIKSDVTRNSADFSVVYDRIYTTHYSVMWVLQSTWQLSSHEEMQSVGQWAQSVDYCAQFAISRGAAFRTIHHITRLRMRLGLQRACHENVRSMKTPITAFDNIRHSRSAEGS